MTNEARDLLAGAYRELEAALAAAKKLGARTRARTPCSAPQKRFTSTSGSCDATGAPACPRV